MIFPGLSYSPIRYFPRKNQNYGSAATFPEYEGGSDYDKGIEFFKSLYMSRGKIDIFTIYISKLYALLMPRTSSNWKRNKK